MQTNRERVQLSGKEKNVLLVDDDALFVEMLKEIIDDLFSEVQVANNVTEALKMIEGKPYSIVMTDLEMPEINGVRLCEKIRETNNEQKLIVSTAHSDETYLLDLLKIGVDGFLKKPFRVEDLYGVLIKVLEN